MAGTLPSNAGGMGAIPGREAMIPHASQPRNQDIKQKQYCSKFNKDFKNGPHQKNLKKNNPGKDYGADSIISYSRIINMTVSYIRTDMFPMFLQKL